MNPLVIQTKKHGVTIDDLKRYLQMFKVAGYDDDAKVLMYSDDDGLVEIEVSK